ncbi:amino acid ABC transporter permease [Achromobacter aloeverae]
MRPGSPVSAAAAPVEPAPRAPFAVLLPFELKRTRYAAGPRSIRLLKWGGAAAVLVAGSAWAQARAVPLPPLEVVVKWAPLLLQGFAFNILISLIAMSLGTAAGLGLGVGLLSANRALKRGSWATTQFFRNVPWLVLLFCVMFLVPYQVTAFGLRIPLPDWIKATVGFALPVMANVAEIVRGAVLSVPLTQWEAAESLAFSPRRTFWRIILPQCLKRMTPPWMNLYSLVAMATVEASIVGVSEMLTLTADVHSSEGSRPELFAPLYGFALICFFLYCYPIDRLTARLERRFHVH